MSDATAKTVTSRRRSRTMAGVVLVTVGTLAASLLGATAPANAATDDFIAISVAMGNETPPIQMIGGIAISPDVSQATSASKFNCISNGGGECALQVVAQNSCVAVATDGSGLNASGTDISLRRASESASHKLPNPQVARIVAQGCSNGQGLFVAPLPPVPPPTPPKLGPTVSFKTIIGGMEADITDRSAVSSQCSYAADDVNRNFALPANSTFALKIVPLIPKFRDLNVTITCDNGTKTIATTHF